MSKPNTITLDDVEYVRSDTVTPAGDSELVIVRSRDSGVTVGVMESREGRDVKLKEAFRVWSWAGAFTLLQMSRDGVSKPCDCKFSVTVAEIEILDACEVIPCTAKAAKNLVAVERCQK